MKIGIICHPTYGGSGAVATELGKALAAKGHSVHFSASQYLSDLVLFQGIFSTMRSN